MKPVIGLTGSIAAGKSTVANVFGACGAMVIDSDKASHEVLQSEQVKKELVAWWGETILDDDGNVDRKAVAAVVFKNPDELKRLEGVIYPRIEMRRQEKITAAQKDPAVRAIVIDAPKLIEAGLDQICDVVVVVDAELALRQERAAARGWSPEELERRENLLEPLDKKVDIADYVIVNNDGTAELEQLATSVFEAVLDGFTQKHS